MRGGTTWLVHPVHEEDGGDRSGVAERGAGQHGRERESPEAHAERGTRTVPRRRRWTRRASMGRWRGHGKPPCGPHPSLGRSGAARRTSAGDRWLVASGERPATDAGARGDDAIRSARSLGGRQVDPVSMRLTAWPRRIRIPAVGAAGLLLGSLLALVCGDSLSGACQACTPHPASASRLVHDPWLAGGRPQAAQPTGARRSRDARTGPSPSTTRSGGCGRAGSRLREESGLPKAEDQPGAVAGGQARHPIDDPADELKGVASTTASAHEGQEVDDREQRQ